ncbi:hypothetical protein ACFL0W_02085 [Nanoarchaeota archaeon]
MKLYKITIIILLLISLLLLSSCMNGTKVITADERRALEDQDAQQTDSQEAAETTTQEDPSTEGIDVVETEDSSEADEAVITDFEDSEKILDADVVLQLREQKGDRRDYGARITGKFRNIGKVDAPYVPVYAYVYKNSEFVAENKKIYEQELPIGEDLFFYIDINTTEAWTSYKISYRPAMK